MNDQTIVAVYDTTAHADAAVHDLLANNVPEHAISQTSGGSTTTSETHAAAPVREPGFWSSLFGGEPDHDTSIYDRTVESGSTVVTVRVAEADFDRIGAILEKHNPVDLDERAGTYGLTDTRTSAPAMVPPAAANTGDVVPGTMAGHATGTTTGTSTGAQSSLQSGLQGGTQIGANGEQTIQLAEETIAVGKRAVMGGTTRIRRYVVETPVNEQVTLHTEKVSVERRPVSGERAVGDHAFTDQTIEMTESSEEAVVSKNVRVTEEVALRKTSTEQVETVSDTVRRDEVKIEEVPGNATRAPVNKPLPGKI